MKRMILGSNDSSLTLAEEFDNEWEDVNSSEFRRRYNLAASKAEQHILDYKRTKFAICFAIIDAEADVGLVSDDGMLFSAVDPDDYKDQTRRVARMYGKQARDLMFKTVYSNKWIIPSKGKTIGNKHFTEAYRLCNYVRDYFQDEENPVSVSKNTSNHRCEILVPGGKLACVIVSDDVLDLHFELQEGSNALGTLYVPAGLRLTPEVAEAIYAELS